MGPFVRLGNAAGATGIATALLVAFGLQFGLNEPPCPLCILQRVAFVLCSFGFVLNLRFGGMLRFAVYLLIAVTLANAVNSFAQCGPADCAAKPTGYWISNVLR